MNEVQALSYDYLDRGLAHEQTAAFWKVIREKRNDHIYLPDFPLQLRYRMTCSAFTVEEGLSPPLLSIGRQSFVVDCFGEEWIKSSTIPDKTPDIELEKLVAPGYLIANQGYPSLDMVHVSTSDFQGRSMKILYERLIIPAWVGKYTRVLCCMTAPIRPIEWLPAQV